MDGYGYILCVCGRSFAQENAYGVHNRSCGKTKKRTADILDKAKALLSRKKQRLDEIAEARHLVSTAALVSPAAPASPVVQDNPEVRSARVRIGTV